ncbi:MAG: hypothetical protein JOZ78_00920 [Chroococcidiopsidaceae cyanobacterium CP_BM_ER_R8_30]|nr:hypothetical protein [Chroococcidiopsidaceae cyanobacterium CP_BM_ER_R8_30]
MPSGHASHKSTSSKPNINTNGLIDEGDATTSAEELLPEGPDALRAAEAPKNSAATQRPEVNQEQE